MNAKIALTTAALAAAFAGSAFAESPLEYGQPTVSGKTVAEVRAELAAYKQAGVNPWAMSYNPLKYFQSTASREAVRAEYLASRNEVKALNGEDSGSAYLAQTRVQSAPTALAGTPRSAQ